MRYKVIETSNGWLVKDTYKGKVVSSHRDRDDAEDVADYKNDEEDEQGQNNARYG